MPKSLFVKDEAYLFIFITSFAHSCDLHSTIYALNFEIELIEHETEFQIEGQSQNLTQFQIYLFLNFIFHKNQKFEMKRNTITPTTLKENRFNNESVDPSAADPMFLSWGSSVNVCDELRRTIRSEIEEIDGSISTLQTNIKNEERSSAQLSKDLSHSRSEMLHLCRDATDEAENTNVNEQIRRKMATTLKMELLANVVSPVKSPAGSCHQNSSDDGEDGEDSRNGSDDMNNTKRTKNKNQSLASQLSMYRIKLQEESKNIASTKKEMQAFLVKINDIEDETKKTVQRIKEADLPSQLQEIQRDVESKKQELESELQRLSSTKESIQRSMKRCGDYAQQIADKVTLEFKYLSNVHIFICFQFVRVRSFPQKKRTTNR